MIELDQEPKQISREKRFENIIVKRKQYIAIDIIQNG